MASVFREKVLTNGGKTRYLHAEDEIGTFILYYTQNQLKVG